MGLLTQESEESIQENKSLAGILGMTQPDLVRPLVTDSYEGLIEDMGQSSAMGRPSAVNQQEHQDSAFWNSLEPFQPENVDESTEGMYGKEPRHATDTEGNE